MQLASFSKDVEKQRSVSDMLDAPSGVSSDEISQEEHSRSDASSREDTTWWKALSAISLPVVVLGLTTWVIYYFR